MMEIINLKYDNFVAVCHQYSLNNWIFSKFIYLFQIETPFGRKCVDYMIHFINMIVHNHNHNH